MLAISISTLLPNGWLWMGGKLESWDKSRKQRECKALEELLIPDCRSWAPVTWCCFAATQREPGSLSLWWNWTQHWGSSVMCLPSTYLPWPKEKHNTSQNSVNFSSAYALNLSLKCRVFKPTYKCYRVVTSSSYDTEPLHHSVCHQSLSVRLQSWNGNILWPETHRVQQNNPDKAMCDFLNKNLIHLNYKK